KPIIQYAVEEAVAAGIEQVIIVTSSQKRAIEDHFDLSYELEHLLEEKGDIEMLRQVRHISDLAQVAYVRQKEQLGLGHAVLMAKDLIGHEPFAVILPDDVVVGERPCIGQLIDVYHQTHASVVAVMEVPPEHTGRYGVIASEPTKDPLDHGRLHRVTALVEKPEPADAPSNLAIIGRYVLTPKIFDKLEQTQRGAGGEIQLTDAISALMEEQEVYAHEFEGTRYDAGTTMGWLQASVELALARPDLGPEFRTYLRGLTL
nr:UTP--glucose-1-phosphate uridylyltransferase [Chloroflexota bacterium]